jgi:hypothetical protein
MKIICRSATQVSGYGIIRKGQSLTWPEGKEYPPQVIANFVTERGMPLKNGKSGAAKEAKAAVSAAEDTAAQEADLIKRTAAIGKAKLEAKLETLHLSYSDKATTTDLARILLRHTGEIAS